MFNFLILIIIVLAYIKIYLGISKFFRLKYPFNSLEPLIVPILSFEIVTIILFMINPNFMNIAPAMIHFVGNSFTILHFNFYAIIYLIINILLIVTNLGLSDDFIPIHNFILLLHFIVSSMFTIVIM
ncbi:hypothetical protein [Streptobacillus moniliformis]|uniref:Uncharacterized protein n=1 Tax=Streptobacillus moniliformis (strain ATCC 14647 / DSM 12112 / NCTC 10651 / 9901) TaxID=519441 RepID=D1AWV7_STRM9|nr:hypothetical protein [Streptobacillus moniliformis]ACZ00783.1 hypothetical protein Smon_0299 [Streptobacillus moniliformis DSM 12112]AVL42819.1 hypothetical protein CEP89_02700 [Streptobacillus moniliformis]QXW65537.1 hypothetical protein KX935_07165 [Streptobacillus moniliformis]SQA14082.1 Uncharacterised protein [Streptobacillus moniliformis]